MPRHYIRISDLLPDPVFRQHIFRTIKELKHRKLGYQQISVVLELYEGVELSARTISEWLKGRRLE